MAKTKNPENDEQLKDALVASESAKPGDAQIAGDEQPTEPEDMVGDEFPEPDEAADGEQPVESGEAAEGEQPVESGKAADDVQPPKPKARAKRSSRKAASKDEQSLEGQMLQTADSDPIVTGDGNAEQNSTKMAEAARKYNNNRSLMREDAQRRAAERQQRQDANEKSLMAWSSLTNAMKNRLIVQVLLTSVRILEDRKTVIASGMVDGFRIVIPYVHMFINPAAVNDDKDEDDIHRAYRQQRMLQKMIGCTVPVIITQMSRATDGDYGILGSRADALMQLRRLNFESNPQRIQEGSSAMADIIAVAEHAVRASVCGFDGSIPIRLLSVRHIENAKDYYTAGQQLRVIITQIKYGKDGHVEMIVPSAIDAEIEDLHDNIYSLAVYDLCVGTITRIPKPRADKPNAVNPWLFLDHYNVPARAMRVRTDAMEQPLKTGDKVLFMVTRLDKERGIAIGDITRRC